MQMNKLNHTNIKSWVVCIAAASFFCFEFFQINMFNALYPAMSEKFNVSGETLSMLSSMYFYGNILLLFPAGILLDRFSTKKLMLFAVTLSLLGTLTFITANSIFMAGLGRFFVGVSGGPFCFLSAMRLAARWFPERKLGLAVGVIVAIGMIGGILSQAPFTELINNVGFKNALWCNFASGLIIFGAIFTLVSDYPKGDKDKFKQEQLEYQNLGFINGIKLVAKNIQNWGAGLFACLLNLPIFILGALWGNMYLIQAHNFTTNNASKITTMLYVGMLIGAPLSGSISDKIKNRKQVMFFGTCLCLGLVYLVINYNFNYQTMSMMFLMIGIASSTQVLVYPMVAEINPKFLTGSAEGLAAVLIMSGGAIFQPLFGFLIEKNWDGLVINKIALYSITDYKLAMMMFPITLIVCLLLLIKMKESYK